MDAERKESGMSDKDTIYRQEAIDTIKKHYRAHDNDLLELIAYEFEELPSAQPGLPWIPVKTRPMDSEEREYWEDMLGEKFEDEDAVMFDCPMPDDGQEILVSYRKWINMDKCEIDGGCYGLEGNGDWEDVIAWMPSPEPYAERREE